LTELAHLVGSLDDIRTPDFGSEGWMREDLLQRIYGRSGRVTYDGIRMIESMGGMGTLCVDQTSAPGVLLNSDYITIATVPVASALIAPRDEMFQQLQRLMVMSEEDARRPLRERCLNDSRVRTQIDKWRKSDPDRTRYFPLVRFMPALNAAGRVVRRGHATRQAVLVALAAEQYRRDQGAYPETVEDMVRGICPPPRSMNRLRQARCL
jgi:hypothetical protein